MKLTNEPGYIFVVLNHIPNSHGKIAGLFYRIETAIESVRMSVTHIDPNPELEFRYGDDSFRPDVGIWLNGQYVCAIEKHPMNSIAVGMVEISM